MRARRKHGTRRGRKLTPAKAAKFLVVLAAGLALAWWVIAVSAVNAFVEDDPYTAARADPNHPRVRIELAMAEFLTRQGRVSAATRGAALHALTQAPLADEPFLLAGVDALAAGDNVRGERLLDEARQRNPRLRMARLLLLDLYLRDRRTGPAAIEMAALSRLIGGVDSILTPVLAQMTQDPHTSAVMLPILRREPKLQETVLEQLASSGADPDLVLRIAGNSGTRPTASRPWQSLLLAGLVAKGEVARALTLWQGFAGVASTGSKGIYDSRFEGLPGPAPFNWDFATGTAGTAEAIRRSGLQVDYYGRLDGDLASQLLVLPPGRYRLRFRAEGDASGQGSRLVWTVSCRSGGAPLLQMPVTGVDASAKGFAGLFTIPAGCGAQWVKLHGAAGDVASEQNAIFSGLSISAEAAG